MEAVRVLRPSMPRSSRSGTLSIIQAAAIDDSRMGASSLRVLVALGTYSDPEGWCWPKQKQLAARIGVTQQAVSKALRDLESHGYIEIHAQHDQATGARLSSRYRIVLEFVLPVEFRRTPQREIVGSQLQIVTPTTSEVVAPTTNHVVTPTTSEVVANKEERPIRTTHKNDPIDMSAQAPEREVFEHFKAKVLPKARVFDPLKIRARLKTFTADELKRGIDNFAADWWWMDNNAARGADWFFHSDRRSEQFLNLVPRPKPTNGPSSKQPAPKTNGAKGWSVNT